MGERNAATENVERTNGAGGGENEAPSGLVEFGKNFWSKTREVTGTVVDKSMDVGGDLLDKGQELGGKVVDELKEVDTKELAEKGKGAAQDGIDIYQGDKSTGNQTVDGIIEFGKGLNPFKGFTDAATDLGEKGLKGEEITRDDLEGAAQGSARDLIPVPESLRNLEQIKRLGDQTGLSQPVIDAVKKATEQNGQGQETLLEGEADQESGLPKVDIVGGAKKAGTTIKNFWGRTFGKEGKDN